MTREVITEEVLTKHIDGLDGEIGVDRTGIENKITAVFGEMDPKEKEQALRTFERLDGLNKTIALTHNLLSGVMESDITKEKLISVLNGLYRKKNQVIQFNVLQHKWNDIQKKISSNKDINTISAHDLLKIEKAWEGFVAKTFAYKQTKDINGNIIEEPLDISSIQEGDAITVDFGKNKGAYWKIGAGDILPSDVKVAKIKDTKGNERIGIRSIQNGKVGYYDEKWYMEVFNHYSISIPTKAESEKVLAENQKASSDTRITLNDNATENATKESYLELIGKEEKREESVRSVTLQEKMSFIDKATILAKKIEEQYGIPWQVTVGQSALESRYGKSGLAQAWNYFGIKWSGRVFATKEVYDGNAVTEMASFRTYSDMNESFLDYAKFLIKNPRYRNAFKYAAPIDPQPEFYPESYDPKNHDPEKFLEEIKKAWYATDPNYVNSITRLWKDNNIEIA